MHVMFTVARRGQQVPPSGERVAGSSEPSAVGDGIEASVLFKNSVHSLQLNHLSRSLLN